MAPASDIKPEVWRFLNTGFNDGFTNMAVDMAMVRCYQGVPILRVYGWKPAAVSLGYHQALSDIDRERCRAEGVDVVFRPTGGRAVLHDHEVTYAVVLGPESRLFDTKIMPVYERISRGILAALKQLTIQLQFERSKHTPANLTRGDLAGLCFASSIQHEIGYQGKKMIGSAQRRFGNVILQHGSILLGREHLRLVHYLAGKSEAQKESIQQYMLKKTVCLNDLTPQPLRYDAVAKALPAGFADMWQVQFKAGRLSDREREEAEQEKSSLQEKSGYS